MGSEVIRTNHYLHKKTQRVVVRYAHHIETNDWGDPQDFFYFRDALEPDDRDMHLRLTEWEIEGNLAPLNEMEVIAWATK